MRHVPPSPLPRPAAAVLRQAGAPGASSRKMLPDHLNCKWAGPRHHSTTFKSQVTRTVPAAFAAGVMELQNLSLQQVLQATEKEPALHVT